MSTEHPSNAKRMQYNEEPIGLWDSIDHVSENGRTSGDFDASNSDRHMIMMLSMTDADTKPDDTDYDETFSIMTDHDNDEISDVCSWNLHCANHQLRSRVYTKSVPSFFEDDTTSVPSFYGDDDEEESFADYSEDWDQESDVDIDDDISTSHVSIRTPPQDDPRVLMFPNGDSIAHISEVTPEPSTNVTLQMISLPQISDVQMQVHRTLRKLACSMRRSDETRTFLKRQRLHYQCSFKEPKTATKEGENSSEHDDEFLDAVTSTKFPQPIHGSTGCHHHGIGMEVERQEVYQMIEIGLRSAS